MDKQEIRERIWKRLVDERQAGFPWPYGRIPNFKGAKEAAALLATHPLWKKARTIKINPDAPQAPVREQALREGKILVMARPRLKEPRCFFLLLPEKLRGKEKEASTIQGATCFGKPVQPEEVPIVDLIVCGSVAVRRDGLRIGKGEGFSELEYALLREYGKIREEIPIVTTVHPLQIVEYLFKKEPFDLALDLIVTPIEILPVKRRFLRPLGILWDHLTEERIASIPALQSARLRPSTPRFH